MVDQLSHAHEAPSRARAIATRWLGVGLASGISVVTLVLGITGRLGLYISPGSAWFACGAAVVTLLVALWSCTVPLGAEEDHDHDHGDEERSGGRRILATAGTVTAGAIASGVVLAALILPPMSLSVDLAMSRANEDTTLFGGADAVQLGVADTATFGVGEWSSVFATATRPESYDGTAVTLTGFVTPSEAGEGINLTRLVITHCVIDAQPVALGVNAEADAYGTGQWVEVSGTIRADENGSLRIEPSEIVEVDEPEEPYEY